MNKLINKVAVVTGGANGIGAGIVKQLITEGAFVYIIDRNEDAGNKIAAELGSTKCTFLAKDITSEEAWVLLMKMIQEKHQKLDILVNNAGIVVQKPWGEMDLATYMRVIEVNQVAVFLGITHALPLLKASKNASIINISSGAGLRGGVSVDPAYTASKFAVKGMAEYAAKTLAPFGIRVNTVFPGVIETPLLRNGLPEEMVAGFAKQIPLGRIGTPEDVAATVIFLASDASSFCTGGEYLVDGGSNL